MSMVRIELAPEFRGDTVVLLAMDGDGLNQVRAAIIRAGNAPGQAFAVCSGSSRPPQVLVHDGTTTVDFDGEMAVWRLSKAQLDEVLAKLDALKEAGPSHHYVDIAGPVDTLVLSKDEYE